jgi:hypothetical protein
MARGQALPLGAEVNHYLWGPPLTLERLRFEIEKLDAAHAEHIDYLERLEEAIRRAAELGVGVFDDGMGPQPNIAVKAGCLIYTRNSPLWRDE